jgi:glycerol-3-phosphate cytidylyltransferase
MIVGITFSTFDLLHAGHVMMLEEAKTQCDWLIAALQTDPTIDRPEKNRPIQSMYERYVQLKACKFVDEIIPYSTEEDVVTILKTRDIDVRIIGEDYIGKEFTGLQTCQRKGIQIYFNERKHSLSSSELRSRIKQK